MRLILYLSPLLVLGCRSEVAHSFAGAWQALPAELQGEVQGMPAHWSVQGKGGAVSTANALATEAGIQTLTKGGNAIDALLAVQWVLAVVEPQSSGLGGGGFLLYYDAKTKKVYALDGREELPENADENLFRDGSGKPLPFPERLRGARAVGVPGTVALMEYAQKRFGSGKLAFAATFARAIELAKQGIRVSPRLNQAMKLNRERFMRQNGGYNPYLRASEPYQIGEAFYQRDLAATLETIAAKGAADFYSGGIAADIVNTVTHNRDYASRMTLADLKQYRVVERRVAERALALNRVYSVSAPASGDFTLNAIPALPLSLANETLFMSASLAAQKMAMAQRERLLEDPDFKAAKTPPSPGRESENTTHVAIADAEGNIVSYTSSVETSMGSALVVSGRGFVLNNQLSDFAAEKGAVNGVETGRRERSTALNPEARETKGAKRPKSSMSPLIILKADGSYAALGSPGGPTILGTNAIVTARYLAGEDLQEAILKPRALVMPNGKTLVELPVKRDAALLAVLRARGFDIDLRRNVISLGSVQAVGYDARTKKFTAASDLRREGLGLVVTAVLE
ncbi:MAG: gamma-glutamyltransferase [Spirochaetes bacterium]|nr:gamma-glutamyltransferase [Spirochaetota bacterium]